MFLFTESVAIAWCQSFFFLDHQLLAGLASISIMPLKDNLVGPSGVPPPKFKQGFTAVLFIHALAPTFSFYPWGSIS
ncbi:uncharacterized protein BYT42DRAFT_557469 [Radiomyces spectabilis]|uniref:uncharacterized protein n=1 Tax=Radiomyces spectabilis TaxID=64574 RepID=UPI00221E9617|nr:uncharacterized protein BYT42DRAFT_557469 [Radiomyces spectabilis]KAI8391608.1 hypothetical protein BYT42DRAFT_557469 [Radiomyces spectabilis]